MTELESGRQARCFLVGDAEEGMGSTDSAPILAALNVVRTYPGRGGVPWGRRRDPVVAVNGVSLQLQPGEILGLVGRSGSGKSTLARLLLGLEAPDRGEVTFEGRPIGRSRTLSGNACGARSRWCSRTPMRPSTRCSPRAAS